MKPKLILFAIVILGLFSATTAFAKLGVGVATGKIVVDQVLKPGTIYDLPPLNVLNTGDETATYGVNIAYHETQWEHRPAMDWFSFDPEEFTLNPGEAKAVKVTLNLPIKATPGKYFAYVEGAPHQKSESGGASIGIAAAAKLYFEIAPANIFVGLYYRLLTFWTRNLPWTNIIGGLFLLFLLGRYLRSHFNFHISKKHE